MNSMKKHSLIIGGLLFMLFVFCCFPGSVFAAEENVTPQDILQSYMDVVLGNRSYAQCNLYDERITEAVMTDTVSAWYGFSFDPPHTFTAFAVTDLDGDGNPELLLQLSEDFGYELLRYQNGQVYGFPFLARAMEAVTEDGEIHASNGADNFGW